MARTHGSEELLCRAEAILAAKWNISIMRVLGQRPARFSELRAFLPGVASNILADRLRSLEADGVIFRAKLDGFAASYTYRLTPLGQAAAPVISALDNWALSFDESANIAASHDIHFSCPGPCHSILHS